MTSLATSFSIKMITEAIGKQKLKYNEEKKIRDIQVLISDFNRKFDNTVVDTYTFQKFIETEKISNEIFKRIFEGENSSSTSIKDLKIKLAKEAIQQMNSDYEKMGRSKINNEEIFYEYFSELIDKLLIVRSEILSWETNAQVAIIKDTIHESRTQIISEIQNLRKHNIFADDKINLIKDEINQYKLDVAKEKITSVLEEQEVLSISQKEEVYYQKSRISIFNNKYEELDDIKNKIERINIHSKYILEIEYDQACYQKDENTFKILKEKFKEHRYSNEQLLLKEVYFHLVNNEFSRAEELLITGDEIKSELKEYHNAHGYFGIILLKHNDFFNAEKAFNKAFELHNNIIYKYNYLIAKRGLLIREVHEGKKGLENTIAGVINDLKEIQYITKFFAKKELVEFWVVLISLIVIKNPKQALLELDKIPESIQKEEDIQVLFADVYYLNEMYTPTKEILLKIWDHNIQNVIKLFFLYDIENDWSSIIDKYKLLTTDKYILNPIIYTLNLKAKYKLNGYEIVKQDVLNLIKIRPGNLIVWEQSLRIVLENADDEAFENIMCSIENDKNLISNKDLYFISQLLLEFKKNEEVRRILIDKIECDERLLELYFSSYEELTGSKEKNHLTYEQVKKLYQKGIRFKFLIKLKISIEIDLSTWRKAIETLVEYRNLYGIDAYYAYNMIYASINRSEFSNLEKEEHYLLSTQNPNMQLIVAVLKAHQERWNEAQNLALKVLYSSHDELSKELLMNFIGLHLSNNDKIEKVNFNHAVNNSVIFLKNENRIRKIAIHQNKELIKNPGEKKFNCENFPYDDHRSLILISEGEVGEKIEFFEEEYEVVEIINLYTYFFRFCMEKIQDVYPDHEYYKTYSSLDPEELKSEIKKVLKDMEKENAKLFEMYNGGVETGLPISYLSGKNIDSYAEMLLLLLNNNKQYLYTGEVSIYANTQYVLSLSSLILLANFGLLKRLRQGSHKYYVSPEVIKSIEIGMQEANKLTKVDCGTLRLNENNQIHGDFYNEEGKKARRKFWSGIRKEVLYFTEIKEKIDDIDLYDLLGEFTLEADIESIEISRKTNKILVCDDLFIRKLHNGITGKNNTTNFVGFLISEGLVTYPELIDIVLKLAKSKYLYVLNSEIILDYCHWLFSLEKQNDREKYFEKLKDVFQYLYNEDSRKYYGNIHDEFMKGAIEMGIRPIFLYEVLREPLKLKPINEFIAERFKAEIGI